jgi:hypothetical protein
VLTYGKARVVGERPASGEGRSARSVGVGGSEDAGMSSENKVRTLIAECLRFPTEGQSASG